MTPTVTDLKDLREKARKKEDRVDSALKEERLDVEETRDGIREERRDILRLRDRRQELGEELEKEIERDEEGKGKRGDIWEAWADARRDEIADLIDGSEARIDRWLENLSKDQALIDRLVKRDEFLEKRIIRIGKKIERKKEDKAGRLTPNFHVVEFDCHDGTPVPQFSIPALKKACVDYLEPLRDQYGAVHINSGFRTRSYNISIGGASMSVHVYDAPWQHDPYAVAIDHTAQGASPPQVQNWHESNTHPDGMGRYGSFTHVDNRNRIGWSDSRWVGP